MITIEFVCSGNNGRSPMAEAVGNRYVQERGLEGNVQCTSSGIRVGSDDSLSYERVTHILADAAKIGIKTEVDRAWYENDSTYRQQANAIAQAILVQTLRPLDAAFRSLVLQQIGIYTDHTRRRTQPSDAQLVLGMEEHHVRSIQSVYRGHPNTPIIDLLSSYAGRSDLTFPDAFGEMTPEPHRRLLRDFQIAVPLAIDKAMRELRT